jgi:hypothetical protein
MSDKVQERKTEEDVRWTVISDIWHEQNGLEKEGGNM